MQHVFNFTSVRHLDATCDIPMTGEDFLPAAKHAVSSLSTSDIILLSNTYHTVYPTLFNQHNDVVLPQSYRKMLSATVKGQRIKSSQYVWAKCVVPFPGPSSLNTDPNVRPAKINYFFVHTSFIDHSFAYVSWPMRHPLQNIIGKPCEVWCSSLNENVTANCIIPTHNIVSLLLTSQQIYECENVLVTVPLVLYIYVET